MCLEVTTSISILWILACTWKSQQARHQKKPSSIKLYQYWNLALKKENDIKSHLCIIISWSFHSIVLSLIIHIVKCLAVHTSPTTYVQVSIIYLSCRFSAQGSQSKLVRFMLMDTAPMAILGRVRIKTRGGRSAGALGSMPPIYFNC